MLKQIFRLLSSHVWLLLWLTFAVQALGQTTEVSFEHIGIEEGLSHSNVQCIIQDKTGYIWFGTYDGLNRYNGYSVDIYKSDLKDSASLGDNNIYSMLLDNAGVLWIGTKYGGLSRFDEKTETFTTWTNKADDDSSLGHNWVVSMHQDSQGTIWLGTGNGLEEVKFDETTDGKSEISFSTHGADRRIPLKIYKINQFNEQKLWLSTSKGLMTFDLNTKTFTPQQIQVIAKNDLLIKDITAGVISISDKLLLGTNRGLYTTRINDLSVAPIKLLFNDVSGEVLSQINTMIKDRSGQIWIGANNSLILMDSTGTMGRAVVHDYNRPNSLSRNHVQALFEDRHGIIWIGTLDGGVNKFDPNKFKFKSRIPFINESPNQQIRSFKSAYQTSDGMIWIGTDFGVHQFLKTPNGFDHMRTIQASGNKELALSDGGVTSMIETEVGELYISHWGSGLDRLDRSFQVTRYPYDENESLTSNDGLSCCIMSMKMGERNTLWMSSVFGHLQKFDPESGSFESFKIGDWVWDIEIDTLRDRIWCATENGFCSFDLTTNSVQCYTSDISDKGSISHNRTWSVYTDQAGRLWVSTYNGIELFDPETETFELYTDPNIVDFNIFNINEDDQGQLWLGTQRGISKFDLRDSSFVHFTAADGAYPDPHWSYRDDEGLLYFGGVNGLNVFNPNEIVVNQEKPTLVFTDLKLFNKSVSPSSDGPIKEPIRTVDKIDLDYSQNVFSIDFAALNYTSSEKNNYAYRLLGFSDEWTYIGNNRTASYTNLNPGNYVLQVKGSNNDMIWNEDGISIDINVNPPFWNTWWFRSLCIFLIFGAILLWIKLRVRMIKLKKKALEKIVVTRTQELQHANEILEQQKAQISSKNSDLELMAREVKTSSQMKINFFTNISHELRTPLSLILGPLEKLMTDLNGSNKYRNTLSLMHTNSMRLLKLINQLLDLSKLDGGFMHMQMSHGDLKGFVHHIFHSFEFMANKNAIDYQFESNLHASQAYFDADKVEKILFNVISNAFKFTEPGGRIIVTLKGAYNEEDKLQKAHITIEDTGLGIDSEDIKKIFERFEKGKAKQGLPHLPGKGIGLSLAKSLAQLHHGDIEVKSEVGLGTQFDVYLDVSGVGFTNSQVLPQVLEADHYVSEVAADQIDNQTNTSELTNATSFDPNLPYILLAEDNHELRTFTSLELSGYFNVLLAENGEAAWKICLEQQPDIVLSDVMMPKMDGNELCQKIKSDDRTSHIMVVLLTAKANTIDQLKGMELGADDYIMKPFSIQLLRLKIKNLLETRHRMQEKYQSFGVIPQLTSNDARDEAMIQKAVAVVEDNLDNVDLNPRMISKEIGLSRSLLYTKIKSLTGMSVSEFVKDIRLKKAAHLLTLHNGLAISELSAQVGFSNHSHFTRSFKDKYGQSPSDYLSAHTVS